MKYGILGGGWAGLLCAYEILKRDPSAEVEILEKSSENKLGGLLRSETIDGFTYDTGGPHILFSRNKKILDLIIEILGENAEKRERKNFIHYNDQIMPYPFENGIFMLPAEERARIGLGIVQSIINMNKNPDWRPETFYDWIYGLFGQEMGSRYLEPYNRKIWKRNSEDMDSDWVFTPGRLPLPSIDDIIFSIAGIPTTGYKEQAIFYYPNSGGILTLYENLLSLVRRRGAILKTNVTVSSVERTQEGWKINGDYDYDRIVNTMPLPYLFRAMHAEKSIIEKTDKLDYNRVIVIGFALDLSSPERIALYVPRSDVVFHRYTWMSNLVNGSPEGKSNIIVEITIPKEMEINAEGLVKEAEDGLLKIGIIDNPDQIIHHRVWVNEFGYPVYMKGHAKLREEIFQFLDNEGIFSVGRWGSWHYWNTDKVYEAVLSLVEEILK